MTTPHLRRFVPVLVLSLLAACTSEAAENKAPAEPVAPAAAPAAAAHVHALKCGCAIEEVGHCGEYIEVDGAFVELAGDLGLGSMPFCKKDGLKALVAGELKDGKFHATSFEYVQ